MKVFLDANILFSSSVPQSLTRKLIAVVNKHGLCVTNAYAVEEARKNLSLKKFGSLEILEDLLTTISVSNKMIMNLPVEIASKDIPILGGAIAQQCTHLLTGDKKDFGFLFGEIVMGVKIVSPRMLAIELKL